MNVILVVDVFLKNKGGCLDVAVEPLFAECLVYSETGPS